MTLAAIIVNYNNFDDCCRCVGSLLQFGIVEPRRVVLVDNNSPDGSGQRLREALPQIDVVLSDRNAGFGAGVNLGFARASDSDYCLVLNPDTYFTDNRIALALAEFEKDPELGVLGLHLTNSDGTSQYSARRFYSLLTVALRRTFLGRLGAFRRMHHEHLMRDAWGSEPFDADWVIGAGMIVRVSAFEQVGRMDEGYFLYLDDTDLCKRMWLAGWRVRVVPAVKLVHTHARASKGLFGGAGKHHLHSLMRFRRKFGLPLVGHGPRR
jgi:N-acetylglucosaminyl-diphospho-decaprenol L-rhamnosyltransferase